MAKAKGAAVATKSSGLASLTVPQGNGPLQPIPGGGVSSPYIQFAHPLAKNYGSMTAQVGSLKPSEPVLVLPNKFVKLAPFQFLAIPKYVTYFAEVDAENNILAAAPVESDNQRNPQGMSLFIDMALLAVIPGKHKPGLIPCRIRLRGPKCPMGRIAQSALAELTDGNYAKQFAESSKQASVAVNSGLPYWAWYMFTATLQTVTPRNTDRGQKPYETCNATFEPTPAIQLNELRNLQSDEQFLRSIQSCMSDADARAEEVSKHFT